MTARRRQGFFLPVSALLTGNLQVYKLQFTTVEEQGGGGGLKDLMEESLCISCIMFVSPKWSTVVLLYLYLSLPLLPHFFCLFVSLRPCRWLPHVYKSPGTHAYIKELPCWVSLARLITVPSLRPVCSSQLRTERPLPGVISLVCAVLTL